MVGEWHKKMQWDIFLETLAEKHDFNVANWKKKKLIEIRIDLLFIKFFA